MSRTGGVRALVRVESHAVGGLGLAQIERRVPNGITTSSTRSSLFPSWPTAGHGATWTVLGMAVGQGHGTGLIGLEMMVRVRVQLVLFRVVWVLLMVMRMESGCSRTRQKGPSVTHMGVARLLNCVGLGPTRSQTTDPQTLSCPNEVLKLGFRHWSLALVHEIHDTLDFPTLDIFQHNDWVLPWVVYKNLLEIRTVEEK